MIKIKVLQTLIPLLSLIALLANPTRSQSTTSFTYDFYGDQPTTLTYQGDAHFPSDSTYLRLTATTPSGSAQLYSTGRVVYSTPVHFRYGDSQADFETTVKFIITPNNPVPADGLTFFIAPVGFGIPEGSTGGNFGIFNPSGITPSIFAVEFDITQNPWDPEYRHIGIDISSPNSNNITRVDDAIIGQEVTARISYVGATKLISVHVAVGGQNYEVSLVQDLATVLPEYAEVGISASTGLRAAIHDVISWYFTSTIINTAGAGADIRQIV